VLIVETKTMRERARTAFAALGLRRLGVATRKALAKFASYQPDTLIADVEFPG